MTGATERRMERLRELRARYRELHHVGMDALDRHDFVALDAAIRGEREIIDEQMRLVAEIRESMAHGPTRQG